jgi:hypothetical protein
MDEVPFNNGILEVTFNKYSCLGAKDGSHLLLSNFNPMHAFTATFFISSAIVRYSSPEKRITHTLAFGTLSPYQWVYAPVRR